jgi:RNA polymerase sigma-70 factor, ECF subfamily
MILDQPFQQDRYDEKTFKKVFDKYYHGLLRFALSYVADESVAENIVQETFITLWEKRDVLDQHPNIKAFLVVIVKNKCINHLEMTRNRMRIEHHLKDISLREKDIDLYTLQSLDPQELFRDEVERLLEAAIDELPEQTKKVFLLSRYEGLSNKEIASRLTITEKGVEFHMTKVLKFLRIRLKDYLPLLFF